MVKNILLIASFFMAMMAYSQTKDDVHNTYTQGAQAYKGENYDEAINAFSKCLEMCEKVAETDDYKNKIIPIYPNLFYLSARNIYKEKKYTDAIARLKEAKEIAAKYEDEKTTAKVDKLLVQAFSKQGSKMFQVADYDSSIRCFNSAIELNPDYTIAYYGKGMAYKAKDDFESMKESFDLLIEKGEEGNKNIAKAKQTIKTHYTNSGIMALNESNYENAIENLTAALDYDDQDLGNYHLIAYANNKLENFDATIEICNKAIEIAGESQSETISDIYFELGEASKNIGDNATACDAFSKVTMGKKVDNAKHQSENILRCGQ